MEKVLITNSFYLPGVNGGGPIQSIKNLVDNLNHQYDFYILTSDRDLGSSQVYKNIKIDEWQKVGNAKVMYTDITKLNLKKMMTIINEIDFKIIYLNSFFSTKYTIYPLILNKLNKINVEKIIVAPRGEFSPGAINLKKTKKKTYIELAKKIGLYSKVVWHSTSNNEKELISTIMEVPNNKIKVINNLTPDYSSLKYEKKVKKKAGELSVIFLSRIHPKKNLKFAINVLKKVKGLVNFNIYGPIEDEKYWEECKSLIQDLPSNIKVVYHGGIAHEESNNAYLQNHVFLFPTLGENFGHVIVEALIGGCPIIISNRTPWNDLEENEVGWDIPLTNKQEYIDALQKCINLNHNEYEKKSKNAFNYGKKSSDSKTTVNEYIEFFS